MWKYQPRSPKPTAYQIQALKRALKLRRFGVFFEQRVGKSRVAIDYAAIMHQRRGLRKMLIVCPKTVRDVWANDELPKYMPPETPYTVTVWKAGKPLPDEPDVLNVVIINYDLIWRHNERFKKWVDKNTLIVADEAHLIKLPRSKRSRCLWHLGRRAGHRLALTGTPYAQRPTDIFGVARFIDERIFGTVYGRFKERYTVVNRWTGFVEGYKNVEELAEKMAPYSIRVLRRDVMREPDTEEIIIPVSLGRKARQVYSELAREALAELDAGGVVTAEHVLTRMLRLQQVTGGWVKDTNGDYHNVSTDKLKAVKELVETKLAGGEQVVVVAKFRPEIESLVNELYSIANVREISGRVSEADRTEARNLFEDGEVDVLVLQQKTSSMGIDLSSAKTMIFYSVDYKLDDYQQVRDRIMGRNQKATAVTYYHIAVPGSVDMTIIDSLRNNENLTSSIANKYKEVIKPL